MWPRTSFLVKHFVTSRVLVLILRDPLYLDTYSITIAGFHNDSLTGGFPSGWSFKYCTYPICFSAGLETGVTCILFPLCKVYGSINSITSGAIRSHHVLLKNTLVNQKDTLFTITLPLQQFAVRLSKLSYSLIFCGWVLILVGITTPPYIDPKSGFLPGLWVMKINAVNSD